MAHLIAVLDPDPARREGFLRRVAARFAAVGELVAGRLETPPFALAWWAAPGAPVSVEEHEGVTAVFGEAIDAGSATRFAAGAVRELWRDAPERVPAPFDGFHAALRFHPREGLIAGADPLGRFPLYHLESGEVRLLATSPESMRLHPLFPDLGAGFDPHGLAGVLLTHGLVEGRTLWRGVRRLGPGALLIARPGAPSRELTQYTLPFGDAHFGAPFERHLELADAALDRAVRRHVPTAPRPLLLLSGGLDSRTLAGLLVRAGIAPLAVTHGRSDDLEVRCATAVARALALEQVVHEDDDPARELADLRTRVRWEHLACGASGTGGWGGERLLRPLGSVVVSGYGMDWVLGGVEPLATPRSFATFFAHHNRWGLAPAVLARLLRRERFGDAVPETLAAIERRYRDYSDDESQRGVGFLLHHRQRFHIAGHAWAESFGAWPVVPAADLAVLAAGCGMPASTLDARRLQIELLRSRFPALARLPIDRNSYDVTPLAPNLAWRLRRRVRRRAHRMLRALGIDPTPRHERRRYYRRYDINGASWRAIRVAAEPLRPLAAEYLDVRVLDELLPPPTAPIELRDGIVDSAGRKALLGFLLWLGHVTDTDRADGVPPGASDA